MGQGKTIKQIADELGVTKQAVHQRIKKEPLSTSLQPFTSTVDGVVYIAVDGESLINSAFNKKEASTDNGSLVDGNRQLLDVLTVNIKVLQEQLSEKDRQIERLNERQANELEAKNKQIEDLTTAINTQAQSINAAHHVELADKLREQKLLVVDDEEKTKPTLKDRIGSLFRVKDQ